MLLPELYEILSEESRALKQEAEILKRLRDTKEWQSKIAARKAEAMKHPSLEEINKKMLSL